MFSAFASVPNVVPAAANHALGDAMCTLPVAHEIALAVIPMLANASTSGDALSILEALAPLLEFSEVDGVQSDVSGDADEVEAKLRIKTTHVAHRLSSYVYAMEVALRNASVNASPDGTDDALPKGESPVFFPALAMCAVFISAAGTGVVAEAVATGGIPSRLVERLSTAAIDELLAAAVPGLRAASLAALATLGDSTSQNEVAAAEAADVGLQAAETAAKDDAEQAANRTPHDAAGLATAALPALDYLAQDESEPLAARLIATVLTSAASATAAQEFAPYDSETEMVASRNWLLRGINDVRLATKKLLAHRNPAGRRGAYAALAAAAEISLAPSDSGDGQQPDTAARAVSNAARAVMLGDDVVGEIVAGGLSDATTRVYAAKCLNCIAAGAGSSDEEASRAAVSLLPWLPWLECDLDDETAGPAVSAAAAAAPTGASPEDAWTPAFEHAVERAAMAAARDALPGAVAAASADASHRAASAVAALTAPKGHGSVSSGTVSPASTSDSPGGSSGGSDSSRSSPSTVLPKDSNDALAFFYRASSHSLAASQVAADAATAAAADRVRRTLPFELHARIQSEARSALRTALSAVKAEARVRAIEARAKTPDAAIEATEEPITSRHAAISHPTLVCETRRALFAACDRVSALTDDGTATNASGHGSELDDAIRDLNSTIRAVLAGDDGSCPSPSHTYDTNGHDAVVDAAGLLAALLFAFPPRDAGKSVSVASGEDAWRSAAAAVSSAWRVAIGGSDDDRVRHVSDKIVAVFLNPARWIPPITGSIAGSPFTQRRAEFAAAATLTSISLSAPWRLAVQSRFLELIDAANEDTGVGCVGIAVLLRTGAAIVEGYVDAAKGPGAVELVEFGKGLMSRCVDASESRTRRRVERALRGV